MGKLSPKQAILTLAPQEKSNKRDVELEKERRPDQAAYLELIDLQNSIKGIFKKDVIRDWAAKWTWSAFSSHEIEYEEFKKMIAEIAGVGFGKLIYERLAPLLSDKWKRLHSKLKVKDNKARNPKQNMVLNFDDRLQLEEFQAVLEPEPEVEHEEQMNEEEQEQQQRVMENSKKKKENELKTAAPPKLSTHAKWEELKARAATAKAKPVGGAGKKRDREKTADESQSKKARMEPLPQRATNQ